MDSKENGNYINEHHTHTTTYTEWHLYTCLEWLHVYTYTVPCYEKLAKMDFKGKHGPLPTCTAHAHRHTQLYKNLMWEDQEVHMFMT